MLFDYIECTTTSIAGSGTGAVTLSRLAGGSVDAASLLLPGDTWIGTSAAMDVDYVIEDIRSNPASPKVEIGKGSVNNNVLTRTLPHLTISGTTVAENAPSALNFGATPTAGNVRIRIAPASDQFIPVPPAIQTTVGSDIFLGYQISAHLNTIGNPSANAALGTGEEYYFPYLNLIRGAIGGAAIDIGTAGTSGHGIKMALYDVGTDGLPGNCITQFNEISVTATGFIKDATPGTWSVRTGPIRIRPGWYYLGMMTNDAAVETNGWGNGTIAYPPLSRADGYGFASAVKKTAQNTYATGMPTGTPTGTYSIVGVAALHYPALGLKITN